MFNLPDFDTVSASDAGATLTLVREDNGAIARDKDGNPITLTVLGSDSAQYRKAQQKNLNRRLAKRTVKVTAEELEAEALDILASATVAWSGFFDGIGDPIPCTPGNALDLYKSYPSIREQADRFVSDRANFLGSRLAA
ncbi:hypothetical protein [Candidatus Contendibacter odensensis]|uniref:Uncharacterized protein n=1 Tax=Candidatus Contendobacter odensis Run_B_J11 TaxID=1400861 RepID=A0A7U7G9U5_9GAMM|nr:hypothetical protein [Candidatus Contendobacter odensis]CDH43851.1 hypothetical protein BN874_1370016 [Candidatus Contendobacter odensis Run_B_J11]